MCNSGCCNGFLYSILAFLVKTDALPEHPTIFGISGAKLFDGSFLQKKTNKDLLLTNFMGAKNGIL
jgi:hypothetical protein